MSTTEQTVADEQAAYEAAQGDGTISGEDIEKGKLFEVPRVAITLDDTDPTVLKLAFSGQIELERGNADQVAFYNRLKAGKTDDLEISVHVAGAKKSHRRDSDGNVDAIVETKSLIVTDVTHSE